MIGVPCITWRWAMTSAFVPHLSYYLLSVLRMAMAKNIKTVVGTVAPSSPKPNLAGTVPQGMTFRPCCFDSSRAVFPTFWWGGIWLWASANAILFRSPYHIRFSRAHHPFSFPFLCASHPPPSRTHFGIPIPAYRYPTVCLNTYNTIRNNTEYHRNGWQWEMEIRTIVIWMKSNDMSESNIFAYNIIAQLRPFSIVQFIEN